MSAIDYFNQGFYSSSGDESSGILSDFIDDSELVSDKEWKPKRIKTKKTPAKTRIKRSRTNSKTDRQKKSIPSIEQEIDLVQMGKINYKIIGRDKEILHILSMILQPFPAMRPLLLGPRGIGKQSIVEKLSRHPRLQNRSVYLLDCNQIIAEDMGDEIIPKIKTRLEKIKKIVNRSLEPKPIIYFRHIEKLMQLEYISEYMQALFNDSIPIIGSISESTSNEKIAPIFNELKSYNFSPITVNEIPLLDVINIVSENFKSNPLIQYTNDALDLIVRLTDKYFKTQCQPIKSINSIQECAIWHSLTSSRAASSSISSQITPEDVADFISEKTGIPAEDLLDNALFNAERFAKRINEKIVGQEYAIAQLTPWIATGKAGLTSPTQPWGKFLFVGPSGVGKTEVAKQLAKELFPGSQNFTFINGSEFAESHTISRLLGAPPGYVGHDVEGYFISRMNESPAQVVIFDEFEKAHDEVRKIFLQILEEGYLTDHNRGRTIDCSKAVFIMTSNIGSDLFFRKGAFNPVRLIKSIEPLLAEKLSPELCGRFHEIIPFRPIKHQDLPGIVLAELRRQKADKQLTNQIELEWEEEAVTRLSQLPFDTRLGAREYCKKVIKIVTTALKDAFDLHKQKLKGKVTLTVDANGNCCIV